MDNDGNIMQITMGYTRKHRADDASMKKKLDVVQKLDDTCLT